MKKVKGKVVKVGEEKVVNFLFQVYEFWGKENDSPAVSSDY